MNSFRYEPSDHTQTRKLLTYYFSGATDYNRVNSFRLCAGNTATRQPRSVYALRSAQIECMYLPFVLSLPWLSEFGKHKKFFIHGRVGAVVIRIKINIFLISHMINVSGCGQWLCESIEEKRTYSLTQPIITICYRHKCTHV